MKLEPQQRRELFKDISGFEGLYQVSNSGKLKSLERDILQSNGTTRHFKEQVISPRITKGYKYATIYGNNIRKTARIHRLVAETFIPNPENKPEVNHKDGDKLNNNDWNLEWTTRRENAIHAVSNGLTIAKRGKESHLYGKTGLLSNKHKIVLDTVTGVYYGSAKEAASIIRVKYGTLTAMLSGVRRNKTNLKYV